MKTATLKTAVSAAAIALSTGCSTVPIKNTKTSDLSSGVNKVAFKSHGVKLAGNLYLPANFNPSKKYPTVVFSGPFNQIKEQMGAVYGKKMAEKGYVFLAFDHYGYGESEGKVRNNEEPFVKMENIRNSISYVRTLPFVDRDRLFGFGGCASGGYVPIVATTDKRLKAIATVSGMMDNHASYFGVMKKEQLIPLFNKANEARQKQYETGKVEYYDALGMESTDLSKLDPSSAHAEGYDYYMTARGGKQTHSRYSHLAPQTLMETAPLNSATSLAPYLYTPYLGIYGEKAMTDTGPLTVNFYEKASEPKELYEVKGASHVSLYDVDEHVQLAVNKMDQFFKKHSK